jgi:type VI secretion system secreted protein Hcp
MKPIYSICMLAGLAIAAGSAAAQHLTITVQAQKQGLFRGEIALKYGNAKAEGRTELLDVRYEMESPRDPATGFASGRRVHKPLTIVKHFGPSSPQYLQALSTNETLPQVLIEGFNADRQGQLRPAFTIKLINASVSHVDSRVAPTPNPAGRSGAATADDMQEVIQFTYQGIEVSSQIGKTMFADSWNRQ